MRSYLRRIEPNLEPRPRGWQVAGDANVFDDAVEGSAAAWQSGALAGLSAENLLAVCERHFRTMPDAARNSGPGFVVKRRLAQLSRTLAAPDGR